MSIIKKIFKQIHKTQSLHCFVYIFCIALLWRLFAYWLDPVPSRDALVYMAYGELLYSGGWDELLSKTIYTFMPPLYIMFIANLLTIVHSSHTAGILISVFSGSMSVALFFFVFERTFKDRLLAIAGTLILLVHPILVSYSIEVQREALFCMFLAINFLLFTQYTMTRNIMYGVPLGVSLFLCSITRIEGLECFIFLTICLICTTTKKKLLCDSMFLLLSVISFFLTMISFIFLSNIPKEYIMSFYNSYSPYFYI